MKGIVGLPPWSEDKNFSCLDEFSVGDYRVRLYQHETDAGTRFGTEVCLYDKGDEKWVMLDGIVGFELRQASTLFGQMKAFLQLGLRPKPPSVMDDQEVC